MSALDDIFAQSYRRSVEDLASAFFRASGLRKGSLPPRWELTDPVIRSAFIGAAQRYLDGHDLVEPTLHMEPRYTPDGRRLNDEWVEDVPLPSGG